MSPAIFVENGVILLESVDLKVHQMMLLRLLITAPVPSVHRPFLASAPSSLGSAVVPGTSNDSPVQVLIDSGASENFVDFGVCHRLNLPMDGDRSSIGMASSEISVQTFGKTTADLNLLDRTYPSSNIRVLKNLCADVIVGQMFLRQHSSVTFMMNGYKEALKIATSAESLDAGRPAVAAADLQPPRLFEFLLPDYKPIAASSRRYSSEDTTFIRSEVQRLLDADIIEPARSPWRAQVLVVKQGEKKRLDIDYSVTINRFTLLDTYPLPNIEDLVNRIARDKHFSSIDLRLAYHQVPLLAEERHYTAFEADGQLFQYKPCRLVLPTASLPSNAP